MKKQKIYKMNTNGWHIERILYLFSGSLVFGSILVSYLTDNNNWLLLTLFVSVMLINFGITGYCPAAIILQKLGFKGQEDTDKLTTN